MTPGGTATIDSPPQPLDLAARFQQLDGLLFALRPYWQFRPFTCRTQPWADDHPALCRWLKELDGDTLERLEQDPDAARRALEPYIPATATLEQLCRLPQQPPPSQALPGWMSNHIPGRKWDQIRAFESALESGAGPYLEWCAGKGHLGRLLSHRQRLPVTSLEIDADLCRQGEALAERQRLPIRYRQTDVLTPEAEQQIEAGQHVVALHACGELHLKLLRSVASRRPAQVSLSPCCYHRIAADHYQPLSEQGRHSPLKLDHHDLRLPLQQSVTAGRRIQRLRHREVTWRLAFDQLQREVSGQDRYLNTPSIPKKLLSGSFTDFCHWQALAKGIELPAAIDEARLLAVGAARYQQVRRMELVRHLFRRPLELWLVLDRAHYLQAQGYRVSLVEFCDFQLTPRNILIRAARPTHHPGST